MQARTLPCGQGAIRINRSVLLRWSPFMPDCFLTTERSEAGYCDFPVAKVRINISFLPRRNSLVDLARTSERLWSPAAFGFLL
jgi:hypothetical protein